MAREELKRVLHLLAGATLRDFDAETIGSRLRIQKAVYIFKALGSPNAADYRYNLYIRGPYSPALAKDYYSLKGEGELRGAVPGAPPPTKASPRTQAVIDAVKRGNDFLEAVTTAHWIAERNPGATQMQIRETFKSKKPHLDSRFDEAWAFLVQHRLANGHT